MSRFGIDVLDCDGHVVERRKDLEEYGWSGSSSELMERLFRDALAPGTGLTTRISEGHLKIEARLEDQDLEGVDVSVNFPTILLGISDFADAESSLSACRAYNNWFADACTRPSKGRVLGAALVPMRMPGAAAEEAHRAITELGACAAMVQPYVGEDVHLSDSEFDPLWSVLEDLGKPVAVHGSRSTCAPKIGRETFRDHRRFWAMSHPFQQMLAMGDFALGGVLARHPRLKVAFLESGIGWMPYYIDRLNGAYEDVSHQHDEPVILEQRPSEYLLSGNCFFSCDPDEAHLAYMVDSLGSDQVIYASDYPHFDCKFPDSVEILTKQTGLSQQTLTKIAGQNARRLYDI
jgi:predicted TIM-barrel fold metal-dependent hydrolase